MKKQSIAKLCLIIVILIGIFFRFANLDLKPYWYDETYTSLQLSGYTHEEVKQDILTGRLIGIEDLQKYQYPDKNSDKTVFDTINNIAKQEAQLTPLYFILARYWVEFWGNSVTVIRSLSAIFSLLTIPLTYWLCWQLFNSASIAWIGMALMAVSPFHILYAQESRPYSLWTLTILLSCGLFLRANRQDNKLNWLLYSFSIILGLYSFLLNIFVYISHGIYLTITQGFRFTNQVRNYLISTISGFILFIPWIYLVIVNVSVKERGFQDENNSLIKYTVKWLRNIGLIFADFNIDDESSKLAILFYGIILLFILILVTYGLYFLYNNAPNNSHIFIFSLILVPAITLTLPDLMIGGLRAVIIRYMTPFVLGIQLVITFLLGKKLTIFQDIAQQKIWQIITVIILSLGVISGTQITFASTWASKSIPKNTPETAMIINQAEKPLIISDFWFPNIISLSYKLDNKVKFQLIEKAENLKIEKGFSDVFLYQPSEDLKQKLNSNYSLESIEEDLLFKLK
ncbi:glycosyltransferase family 39 protein [Geminocystis sp.]|uniref:glycosyltransferase family 39 protein n=1 Tax=Geminocystis sp. TaxID=2664100 RepID=UPI0035941B74